jgi:NTE family protein
MNVRVKPYVMTAQRDLPFECVALVLQGGGALGAYQAGVYEALSEAAIHPDWIAGISIGAINAAIIAGNPPNSRADRLREFWTQVTTDGFWPYVGDGNLGSASGDAARDFRSLMSATGALASGASGFFAARPVNPWLQPRGAIEATSFYDTKNLKRTLERLVDFDRLNAGPARFSVGAVNVRTGNFVYFDNTTHTIRPEHVMASGALPPAFPAIEIEGEHYWDGSAAARFSRHRDRRRALLGRRPRFEHAAAMGGRGSTAPRHFGLPGRLVERKWRVSAQHARSDHAGKGDSLLQPHPCGDRSVQVHSAAARRCCRPAR